MKSVLIPTDFSAESRNTLEYVLDLLKDSQVESRILLLNTYIVKMDADTKSLIDINDDLKVKSRLNLEIEMAWARERIKNQFLKIEMTSHMGTLNNVILNLIKKEKFDLLAMGRSKDNRVEQMAPVLKQHNCSLLII